MANDSAKKMLATNTALMRKYTRVILGCNVSTLAKRDTRHTLIILCTPFFLDLHP